MARQDKESIRTRILAYVFLAPGATCAQIQRVLNVHSYGTVSGLLCKLVEEKLIRREENQGPRGGYGYYDNRDDEWWKSKPSKWDLILDPEF